MMLRRFRQPQPQEAPPTHLTAYPKAYIERAIDLLDLWRTLDQKQEAGLRQDLYDKAYIRLTTERDIFLDTGQ